MIGNKQQLAGFQIDFYRRSFHKIVRALNVLSLLMVVLIIGIIYFVLFKPPSPYYGTTTTGQIIPMKQIVPRS